MPNRYSPMWLNSCMQKTDDGAWILYQDYQALRESHDRLLEALRNSNKVIEAIPTGFVWPDKKRQLGLNREAITNAAKLQEGK